VAVDPIASAAPSAATSVTSPLGRGPEAAPGFGGALDRLLDRVDQASSQANVAIARMLDGSGDVHEAMVALQQADLSFQFAVQVRNKLVQAYHEIMRMPV
jgi:flagellar hook-basal body complex protein FliE